MLEVAIVLAVLVVWWVLWISGVVSAARRPGYAYRAVGRRKPLTITLIAVTGWIGGAYFLLRIRPQLRRAEEEIPPPIPGPGDTGNIKEWRRTGDPWS